jgi:enamine deaminase RidA (YjgF/YER057c/UK114 family)
MITRIASDVDFLSNATVHGGLVYVAGQVALNNPKASVTVQAEEIFASIDAILAEAGSDKNHILKADIWLTDIKTAPEFNAVWMKWLNEGKVPARACVESKFSSPDWYVEVAVIAALKH